MQKFSSVFVLLFLHLKLDFMYSSLSFIRLSWTRITDKLAINRQNFLKFDFNSSSILEYGRFQKSFNPEKAGLCAPF